MTYHETCCRQWDDLAQARHELTAAAARVNAAMSKFGAIDSVERDSLAFAIQDAEFAIELLRPLAAAANRCTVVASGNCVGAP
jgi:hypothetical protein